MKRLYAVVFPRFFFLTRCAMFCFCDPSQGETKNNWAPRPGNILCPSAQMYAEYAATQNFSIVFDVSSSSACINPLDAWPGGLVCATRRGVVLY